MKLYMLAISILFVGAVSSCTENNTTAPDLGFIQMNPRTVEVVIPYADFVDEMEVFGGYGSKADFGRGIVALDHNDLTVRSLMSMDDIPTSVNVGGSSDSDLSFVGGRVVLAFDTLRGTINFPVDLEVFDVREEWHGPSVDWDATVDTVGDRRLWTQPGGGANTSLGTGSFDAFADQVDNPAAGLIDTLSIPVDSAALADFVDPAGSNTGFLLAATKAGSYLNLLDMKIVLNAVPASRPDTVIEMIVVADDLNFIVEGVPGAPTGWIRVGGAPSWRSVLTVSLPRTIEGTPELCGEVGCQIDLAEVSVNLAELVLTTRESEPGFQPLDTTGVDLRRVLNPELLPKSPLGDRLLPIAEIFPPDLFSTRAGIAASFVMTDFVTDMLSDAAETGTEPVASLSLFSAFEPNQIGFASFEGPGGAGEPTLRLLYTIANAVGLP